MKRVRLLLFGGVFVLFTFHGGLTRGETRETARLTYAPQVPPPITRTEPAIVEVHLDASSMMGNIDNWRYYRFWTFNGHVPGPFIRTRVGDTLEIHFTNHDTNGMPHNIDFHAVTGPGGGAQVTTIAPGQHAVASFKLLNPGLYMYHCAVPPMVDHIANGMYGLILVEPENGLPKADREFYVMQSEVYTQPPVEGTNVLQYSHDAAVRGQPQFVLFNGSQLSLYSTNALKANVGEKVRIYFGNAGPNLVSSFHIIGMSLTVYHDGVFSDPAQHLVQTTLVPAGGASVVEFTPEVPGAYTLIDHSAGRVEQGASGTLNVAGPEHPEIYRAEPTSGP
jgi:nitrite reductase (NO-forming)